MKSGQMSWTISVPFRIYPFAALRPKKGAGNQEFERNFRPQISRPLRWEETKFSLGFAR